MKNPDEKPTWAKTHIQTNSTAYAEGAAAAENPDTRLEDCPHDGLKTPLDKQQQIDWCAGFSAVRWPVQSRRKMGIKQIDIEELTGKS